MIALVWFLLGLSLMHILLRLPEWFFRH
jgi:hypothetical protein